MDKLDDEVSGIESAWFGSGEYELPLVRDYYERVNGGSGLSEDKRINLNIK